PVRAASAIELWRLLRREYAYRTLGDEDIDAALLRVLPAVIAARDSIAYATALRDLLAATSDSRATLDDPTLDARLGAGELPVDVRAIDGEMVVTRVHAAARASGIEPGDVIERLDDDPIERKFDAFDRLVSASNSWRRRFDLVQLFARGPIGSSVAVQVRRPTTRNRTEQRTLSLVRVARDAREEPPRGAALSVPAPGVALLDATQLDSARVDSLRALSASARPRALLVDLRQGVSPTAASLLAWLADRPDVPVALERRTIAPTLDERERLTHERTMVLRADTTSRYAGRVVVFIDERVDDAAERVALALVTLGAVPIGGPTAGAVGPRARQELPGGFAVTYAHRDVRWPDGRQLQRIGIQSLVDARPTVAGMRAGIDESVAAALRWIDPPRAPGRSR
ncbi:MAG: S41 family peptidase, partial [Gemmatimonadaceae bacterium]|nr:S41 family peptidase [Gemmatimonadaceae bacterium]